MEGYYFRGDIFCPVFVKLSPTTPHLHTAGSSLYRKNTMMIFVGGKMHFLERH